jgi:hypothetical protein
MGSITRGVEPGTNVTVFTVVGETDVQEVLTEVVTFLRDAPTLQVLWDIRRGALTSMSARDLRTVVQRAGPLAEVRAGGQTAIVCSREVDFGLGRMFQTYAEEAGVPFAIRVFRDVDDAWRWLRSEDEAS